MVKSSDIMNVKKLVKNLTVLCAIILAFFCMKGVIVKAGEAYSYGFSFDSVGSWDVTNTEGKYNSSYVSMQCEWAEVDGSCYNAYATDGDGNYVGDTKTFYEGTWDILSNYINENGSDTAKINAYLLDDCGCDGANFSGYWYADSDIY